MTCPVCDATEFQVINIRIPQESDLKQLGGSTWDAQNMARCNGCGVLYDRRYAAAAENDERSCP